MAMLYIYGLHTPSFILLGYWAVPIEFQFFFFFSTVYSRLIEHDHINTVK
jgi:hypothetical protein